MAMIVDGVPYPDPPRPGMAFPDAFIESTSYRDMAMAHREERVYKLWKRMARVTTRLSTPAWEQMWARWNTVILRNYGPPH